MFRWPQMPSRAGVGFFNVRNDNATLRLLATLLLRRVEAVPVSPYLDPGNRDWPPMHPPEVLARIPVAYAAPLAEDRKQQLVESATGVRVRTPDRTLALLRKDANLRVTTDADGLTHLLAPRDAELLARGSGPGATRNDHEELRLQYLQGRMEASRWASRGQRLAGSWAQAGKSASQAAAALGTLQGTLSILGMAGVPIRPSPAGTVRPITNVSIDDDDALSRATMMTIEAPPGYELVSGKTFPVKDQLRALGGRWSPENKGWFIPVHHADEARVLVRRGTGPASTVQTYPCWECGVPYTPEEYLHRNGKLEEWWCGCGVVAPPRKHRPNFGR
jgi:hypothetical protein